MNPYEILGISPNASDDEIKRAYRELSRKYHPDSYSGNPLSSLAEEKFKQVQEAYNTLMKERSSGYYANNAYHGNYGSESYEASSEFQVIVNYLSERRYGEAIRELDKMSNRTAKWYYFSAIAHVGLGNMMRGTEYARTAVSMDPGNPDYQNFLNQLNMQGQRYGSVRSNYGGRSDDAMDMCCKLWMADTLCECLGGDLCSCM